MEKDEVTFIIETSRYVNESTCTMEELQELLEEIICEVLKGKEKMLFVDIATEFCKELYWDFYFYEVLHYTTFREIVNKNMIDTCKKYSNFNDYVLDICEKIRKLLTDYLFDIETNVLFEKLQKEKRKNKEENLVTPNIFNKQKILAEITWKGPEQ